MSKWMNTYDREKYEAINNRLALAVTYFRLLNRLTPNQLEEKTGVNIYRIENRTEPVTVPSLVKLQTVFGEKVFDNILNHAWHGEGEWNEQELKKRIKDEQKKWNEEREKKNKK